MNILSASLTLSLLIPVISSSAANVISPVFTNSANAAISFAKVEAEVNNLVLKQAEIQIGDQFAALRQVLTNEKPMFLDAHENVYLYDYFKSPGNKVLLDNLVMAVIDMDGDSISEVILKDEKGFHLVLHEQGDSICAYEFSNREMSLLKSDGSFVWSNGKGDNGYAMLAFTESSYEIRKIVSYERYIDSHNNDQIGAFKNGELMTLEEISDFVSDQNAKRSRWFDFTEDNVRNISNLTSNTELDIVSEAIVSFQNVLYEKEPFFDVFNGFRFLGDYYINFDFDNIYDNVGMQIEDIDKDSVPEVILSCFPGILNVLHYRDGQIYSYTHSHRQINDLKEDGTFGWSSGAGNHGYGRGRAFFDDEGLQTETIAELKAIDDEVTGRVVDVLYTIDGVKVTLDEYEAYVAAHNQKESARGYYIADGNIASLRNLFYNIPLDFN